MMLNEYLRSMLGGMIPELQDAEWPEDEALSSNIDAAIVHLDCARQNLINLQETGGSNG